MNAIAHAHGARPSGPQLDNRRVVAGLIDLLVIGAGGLLIGLVAGSAGSQVGVIGLAWALYYYFALESGGGQTLGKKAMKLRVVRADGSPVGMREVAVRTILRVVDGLGVYVVGLVAMLATGKRRQRLGDLAAGTVVTSADVPPAAPVAPAVAVEPEPEIARATTLPQASVVDAPEESAPEEPPVEAPAAVEPETDEHPPLERPTLTVAPEPPSAPVLAPVPDVPADPPAVPELRPFDPFPETPGPAAGDAPVVEQAPTFEIAAPEPPPLDLAAPDESLPETVASEQLSPEPPVETPPAEDESGWSFPITGADVPGLATDDVEVAPVEPVAEEPVDVDDPMTVKSVETVSAMDLLMDEVDQDETAGSQR